uniref:Uncharacterized protein n=1 Tax=Pinguiococcus pyrenoidosus TaxID=172671 RepID=A0A7R9Y953_9STRA|mmetsp:Transcript_13787/g.51437  ORF Transcript_13787/g.51437 Transcript_13787/m.51437 type:complete len:529 (+) Transcript_13787:171-1757(+)
MALDIFIIIFLVVVTIAFTIGNVYLIVEWQHPADKNQAYAPKVLCVFGLLLIQITILLLPLDVQNSSGEVGCAQGFNSDCGDLNMRLAWFILYCIMAFLVIIVFPFAIFYYEADDGLEKTRSPLCSAVTYTFFTLAIALVILLCMFFFIGITQIPVREHSVNLSAFQDVPITSGCLSDIVRCTMTNTDDVTGNASFSESDETVELPVSFPVYLIALMAFVGYFFFVIFGGVGMAALPIDLILSYVYRPKRIDQRRFREEEKGIQKRSKDLIEIAQLLKKERSEFAKSGHSMWEKRKRRQQDTITINKFKQMVYILEQDYETLKLSFANHKKFNPLIPYMQLVAGVLSCVFSLLWILQIILFILVEPPATAFLNEYFEWYDQFFPLFGILSVALFALYLMCAVVKGCFKIGVRCFCIELHPMKYNATYMNSFLFNIGLLLLCSIPVVHFSTEAFSAYAANTDAANIFNGQIRYMVFFTYFFAEKVFIYIFLILSCLSLVYLLYKPRDTPASAVEMKAVLARNSRPTSRL